MNHNALRTGAAAALALAVFPILAGSASGSQVAEPTTSSTTVCAGEQVFRHLSFGSVFEEVHQRGRSPQAVALTYGMEANLTLCDEGDGPGLTGLAVGGYGFVGQESGAEWVQVERVALIDEAGAEIAVNDMVSDSRSTGSNFARSATDPSEAEKNLGTSYQVSVDYRVGWADGSQTQVSRTSPPEIPMNSD